MVWNARGSSQFRNKISAEQFAYGAFAGTLFGFLVGHGFGLGCDLIPGASEWAGRLCANANQDLSQSVYGDIVLMLSRT